MWQKRKFRIVFTLLTRPKCRSLSGLYRYSCSEFSGSGFVVLIAYVALIIYSYLNLVFTWVACISFFMDIMWDLWCDKRNFWWIYRKSLRSNWEGTESSLLGQWIFCLWDQSSEFVESHMDSYLIETKRMNRQRGISDWTIIVRVLLWAKLHIHLFVPESNKLSLVISGHSLE